MDLDQYLEKMNTNTKIIWIQDSGVRHPLTHFKCAVQPSYGIVIGFDFIF